MIRVWAITALGRGCEESFEGDFSTISGDMRLRDLLFQHKQRRQCKREYLGRPEVSFNAFSHVLFYLTTRSPSKSRLQP